MRTFLLASLLLGSSLIAGIAFGQTSEGEIKASLVNRPLYIRGMWHEDVLKFDSAGKLTGSSLKTSFTVSGIDVRRVKLKHDHLEIEGQRVALIFTRDVPKRVPLDNGDKARSAEEELVKIEIAAPASGDYTQALHAVFASSLEDLAPTLPPWWQPFAAAHLEAPGAVPPVAAKGAEPAQQVGGAVTAPELVTFGQPGYSPAAMSLKINGIVTIGLQVDATGKPDHVVVVHAVGAGLDERAIAVVEKYRYKPATEGGQPVRVELTTPVRFEYGQVVGGNN